MMSDFETQVVAELKRIAAALEKANHLEAERWIQQPEIQRSLGNGLGVKRLNDQAPNHMGYFTLERDE